MDIEYRWDTLRVQDVEPWASLVNHLAEADGTEEFYSAQDLADDLASQSLDPAEDTLSVWDAETLVAFGVVWVKSAADRDGLIGIGLDGGVHPQHRGRGLGTQLMQRLEARAVVKAGQQHGQGRGYFGVGGARADSAIQRFHESRGYEVARWYNLLSRRVSPEDTMEKILGARIAPEGVAIRQLQPEDEAAVHQAHCAAFVDHWGSAPPSAQRWHEGFTSSSGRHDISRIAVDAQGNVLAYCLMGQYVEREAYAKIIGTVPQARGRGVGSAVVAASLAAVGASDGYDVMELDVDSESLTGATRMYERLGFELKFTTSAMRRPVSFGHQ